MRQKIKQQISRGIIITMLMGVFVLDLLTPLGYAVWLIYLVPLLFIRSFAQPPRFFFLPAVSTLLLLLGFFLAPPGLHPGIAFFNRFLAIGAVWGASFFLLYHMRTEEQVREQAKLLALTAERVSQQLVKEVEEKTKELDREKKLLQAVLMGMPAGVFIAEAPSGRLVLGNKQVERIWRHPFLASEDISHYREYKGFHPDGRPYDPEEWPLARSILHGEVIHDEEIEFLRGDNTRGTMRVSSAPVCDKEDRVIAGVVIFNDITERKEAEEFIDYQVHHDLLTGLPNRALFMDRLVLSLAQAHRNRRKVAVLSLDIDRFKIINDALGHTAGDLLLKEVAVRLRECVRGSDTFARMGGDDFTILLPVISHAEDAAKIAKKTMACLKQPCIVNRNDLHITVSIGISIYPDDADNANDLLRNANTALFHAKKQGMNNYQFYNDSFNVRSLERILLENSLRRTLELGELVLHYQPQIDIRTDRIVCVEALVRWRHPELGLLNPLQFIPLAEEIGFIVPIDEWVLRTACAQGKAWQDAGYPPLCITVNLSARQLKHPHLSELVGSILKETGLTPDWLELEITETIAMEDVELTIPLLARLVALGVHFSIDDFGTGYSSLSYLKRFPIHKLKIDKSFIRGLPKDPDDRSIVAAVITLAHNLDLKVVAEGVETEEQLSFLRSRHCDAVQGFILSEPLPPDELGELLLSKG